MCVYTCVYPCIRIRTCIYIYNICVYAYDYMCMYVCVYVYMYVCVYVFVL